MVSVPASRSSGRVDAGSSVSRVVRQVVYGGRPTDGDLALCWYDHLSVVKRRGKTNGNKAGNSVAPRVETSTGPSLSRSQQVLVFALLLLAVLMVYQPAWHGAMLWDDD